MIEIILLIFAVGILIILILVSAPKVKHHYSKAREEFERLDVRMKDHKRQQLYKNFHAAIKHYLIMADGILLSVKDLQNPKVDSTSFLENIETLDEAIEEVTHGKGMLEELGQSVTLTDYITKRQEVSLALKKLVKKRKDVEEIKKSISYVAL